MSGALILTGYALLIWQAGWWGVAATGIHIAVMLACVRR